jgi:hypothetical protein
MVQLWGHIANGPQPSLGVASVPCRVSAGFVHADLWAGPWEQIWLPLSFAGHKETGPK